MPDNSPSSAPESAEGVSTDNEELVKLPNEVEVLLEDVPEPQRQAVRAVLVGISSQRIWRGPHLPPTY